MKPNFKGLLLCSIILIIFVSGCEYQEFDSLDFSDSAKEELRQLLQKPLPDTLDIIYNFNSKLAEQTLVDITFRNVKQENKQRKEAFGNLLGFNLSAYSVINNNQQVTCALFDNEWKCDAGDKVCKKTSKGKVCQSVSQEGIPPIIKPEQLAKAKVASSGQKQILGLQAKCYKLLTTENGRRTLTEACLNQEGIIMLIAIDAKLFKAILEAKSFSTNVQPDVFNLPIISTQSNIETTQTKNREALNISQSLMSSKVNVTVTSNPSGAAVYVDGYFAGNAPFSQQMPLGIHLVRCVLDGYADTYTSVGITEAGFKAGGVGIGAVCNMKPLISQG